MKLASTAVDRQHDQTLTVGAPVHVGPAAHGVAAMHSGPGASYSVTQRVPYGTMGTVLGARVAGDGGWAEVAIGEASGWLAVESLAPGPGLPAVVVRAALGPLPLREGPRRRSASVATVPAGALGEVLRDPPRYVDCEIWVAVEFFGARGSPRGWVPQASLTTRL